MPQSIKEELIQTLDRLSREKLLAVLHFVRSIEPQTTEQGQPQQALVLQKRNLRWRIFLRPLAVVIVVMPRVRYALMQSCMAAKKRHECVC